MILFLKIANLEFSYEDKKVLNNVTFNLFKGETLGLIGESGSENLLLPDLY